MAHADGGKDHPQDDEHVETALHVADEGVRGALVALGLAQREEEHQGHDGRHQQHDAEEHAPLGVRQIDGQVERGPPRHRHHRARAPA